MTFIGLIPARGGSKRIPRKNLAACAGRPLLAWTAEAALESKRLDRAVLSTDDDEIAEVGQALGLEVPFSRAASAATDQAPMIDVLIHAANALNMGDDDALVLLQPTSPLRQARHIDEAIEIFAESNTDSLVSVTEVPHQFHPWKCLSIRDGKLKTFLDDAPRPGDTNNLELPAAYGRNGPSILISRTSVVRGGQLYGTATTPYVMPPEVSIDIDLEADLQLAGMMIEKLRPRAV